MVGFVEGVQTEIVGFNFRVHFPKTLWCPLVAKLYVTSKNVRCKKAADLLH